MFVRFVGHRNRVRKAKYSMFKCNNTCVPTNSSEAYCAFLSIATESGLFEINPVKKNKHVAHICLFLRVKDAQICAGLASNDFVGWFWHWLPCKYLFTSLLLVVVI